MLEHSCPQIVFIWFELFYFILTQPKLTETLNFLFHIHLTFHFDLGGESFSQERSGPLMTPAVFDDPLLTSPSQTMVQHLLNYLEQQTFSTKHIWCLLGKKGSYASDYKKITK